MLGEVHYLLDPAILTILGKHLRKSRTKERGSRKEGIVEAEFLPLETH